MATPFWYNAALSLLKPLYRSRIRKRAENKMQCEQEILERFGPFQTPKNRQAIWFHAVSVGETNAAQPLIEHYLKLGHCVLVTNTTKTGQARAKSLFSKEPYQDLFQAVFLPADQKHLIQQFYQKYQPRALILVETELWPNLIDQAKHFKVPTILMNARLSAKSAKGYARVKALTQPMLKDLNLLLAQDQATQQRYVELGLDPSKTQIVGNIKFDIQAPTAFSQIAEQLKQQWQLAQRKVMVIASTHAPEEQKILTALAPYLAQHPAWLCIVVPRHPERFNEVFQITEKLNLVTKRRSLNEGVDAHTQVYLADSMGEMWLWYALSQVCFVGGSLNEPGGGHNVLEPIAMQVATVVGPHYFNFQTIIDEFLEVEGIKVVQDEQALVQCFAQWLDDPEQRQTINQQAQQVMSQNQGSLARHVSAIDAYL